MHNLILKREDAGERAGEAAQKDRVSCPEGDPMLGGQTNHPQEGETAEQAGSWMERVLSSDETGSKVSSRGPG